VGLHKWDQAGELVAAQAERVTILLSSVISARSWDYCDSAAHVSAFLATLERIESVGVPLFNSSNTVRWNHNKVYLRELTALGVPTVDTLWVNSLPEEKEGLANRISQRGWVDCVIKPVVSAGGMHTYRFSVDAASKSNSAASCLSRCMESGLTSWLVQPFCQEILDEGEWSFIFLNGEYSHCVLSVPAAGTATTPAFEDPDFQVVLRAEAAAAARAGNSALSPDSFKVQAFHGGRFSYQTPSPQLITQAHSILHATPYGRSSLHARVDCVRRGDKLLCTELELIEPFLFSLGVSGFQQRFLSAFMRQNTQR
jgi:hypothetical protein